MTRSVPEWIGKTDNTPIPPRVKLRVFEAYHGNCTKCLAKIVGKLTPQYDHAVALINGGENRESNIQLICSECHKLKTKKDVAEKSQVYHKRVKALGIKARRRTIGGRKFNGEPIFPKWK